MSADAQFRERFEREARTISQLNHAHICTLHDVGEQEDVDYLVFEYLEGETLADRLKTGPLPIEQALAIATDICDALDRAHRRGVVHRDLKPGNVMLVRGRGAAEPVVANCSTSVSRRRRRRRFPFLDRPSSRHSRRR